ncbi:DUF6600 domain-containing protein [Spirosoma sp. KUDC1026]|uniref:DUF6600 domain-containing protein n=1 Tax=Spirosoma sp. KUDC1026 TaxID=2745947 RepID=UPI001E453236|nr:DUF6600 domain-containing protein [Spirosoma sp. KUDC1026]
MNALRKIGMICLIAWAAIGLGFTGCATAQPGMSVPVESFYDELAPYGQWTQYPGYGNAWIPSAGPDFQPYASNGHWIVTEYGNTWVSNYDWGWAPFHYGRWIYDPAYGGWLWLPGSDWGPAWVSWRSGGGYYGWAPLGPGVNINVNVNLPAFCWTFVPQAYITSPRLYNYRVARPNVVNIYHNTTIINNVYRSNNRAYVYGPQRGDIERVTRQSVPVYRIDQINRPGRSVVSNGSVGFYHPGNGRSYSRDYSRADRNPGRDFNNYNSPNSGYGNGYSGGNRSANPNAGRSRIYEPGNYNRSGTNPYEGRGGYSPDINTTPGRGFDNTPGRSYSPEAVNPGNTPGRSYERMEQPQRSYQGNDMNPGRQNGFGQQPERSYGRGGQMGGIRNESTPNARQERTYQQQAPSNGGFQGGREAGGGQRSMPGQPGGGGERQSGGRGPR